MIFISQLLKNIKSIMTGFLYPLFVLVLVIFMAMQFGDTLADDLSAAKEANGNQEPHYLIEPTPNQESYGTTLEEIPQQVMPNTVGILLQEYKSNAYSTYPLGLIKEVTLSNSQQDNIKNKIMLLTGVDTEALIAQVDDWRISNSILEDDGLTYVLNDNAQFSDKFKEIMADIDDMLGGNSSYDETFFWRYSERELTYEEAESLYEEIVIADGVSGAFARETRKNYV